MASKKSWLSVPGGVLRGPPDEIIASSVGKAARWIRAAERVRRSYQRGRGDRHGGREVLPTAPDVEHGRPAALQRVATEALRAQRGVHGVEAREPGIAEPLATAPRRAAAGVRDGDGESPAAAREPL